MSHDAFDAFLMQSSCNKDDVEAFGELSPRLDIALSRNIILQAPINYVTTNYFVNLPL